MFEHKTEQQAREEILNIVKEYCETYHNQKKAFKEGDRISYASRVYDSAEMVNLVDSSDVYKRQTVMRTVVCCVFISSILW